MGGDGGDGWANASEEGNWEHGVEEYDEEEDGYEFGDAEGVMQCVEMAERSAAARAHDYEELAARKRKALAEEQPHREESSKGPRQDDLSEAESATMFDQLMEGFGLRHKRRSKEAKKRGRKKEQNKYSPEITKMLGDATLLFTERKFKENYSESRQHCHHYQPVKNGEPEPSVPSSSFNKRPPHVHLCHTVITMETSTLHMQKEMRLRSEADFELCSSRSG